MRRNVIVLLLAAGVAGVVVVVSCGLVVRSYATPPSDEKIIGFYMANPDRFDRCVDEFGRLGVYRILADSECGTVVVKPEFVNVCADMSALGVRFVEHGADERGADDGSIHLVLWAFGMAGSNRKGVAWVSDPRPGQVKELLDDRTQFQGRRQVWYRPIAGRWYVFYEG